MYAIDAGDLVDRVDFENLEDDIQQKVNDALEKLTSDPRPALYDCKPQPDGSYQIALVVGRRRILLGYDIDSRNGVVSLNYLKWDWLRQAIDWTVGLLGNDPGGTK